MLNFFELTSKIIEDISNLNFSSKNTEELKKSILSLMLKEENKKEIKSKLSSLNENIINEVNENSNIQLIINDKSNDEILSLTNELIRDLKEQNNLKKIESLEKKLINNLDENSYSELIKLKSQLNRD